MQGKTAPVTTTMAPSQAEFAAKLGLVGNLCSLISYASASAQESRHVQQRAEPVHLNALLYCPAQPRNRVGNMHPDTLAQTFYSCPVWFRSECKRSEAARDYRIGMCSKEFRLQQSFLSRGGYHLLVGYKTELPHVGSAL